MTVDFPITSHDSGTVYKLCCFSTLKHLKGFLKSVVSTTLPNGVNQSLKYTSGNYSLLLGIPEEELEDFAGKRDVWVAAGCCHSAPDLDKQLENKGMDE